MKAVKFGTVSAALLLVGGMLAGCGGNGDNGGNGGGAGNAGNGNGAGGSGNGAGAEKVEVTLMTWESQDMNNRIMEAMKPFEEQNPGITVKLLPAPLSDYGMKLNGMIAAKQAPDIFELGNDMMLQDQAQNLLYDWTSQADADQEFMSGFYPGVVDSWHVDGKVYGLPGLLNTYGIFYNKKLFQDAGVPEPKPGWTYDDFFSAMEKLASKKGGVQQYGYYGRPDPFTVSTVFRVRRRRAVRGLHRQSDQGRGQPAVRRARDPVPESDRGRRDESADVRSDHHHGTVQGRQSRR